MLARLSSAKLLFILAFTLYFLLLGHKLMRIGIHGDGLEYATVAMNMADDVGSFWKPYLDDHIHPVFHEHPPLVFWIQSIFFRIFGDGLYLESFYGALVGLVILGCMALFWQRVRSDFKLPPVGIWWPVLMMISLPIYTYLMQTNRLICTYTILAILPTYASYRSMIGERHHLILFSLLSGMLIYLGFIAKGPVAFFTFAVPALAWIALKAKFSRVVISTLLALGTLTLALSATFYFFPDSQDFWKGFWQAQVVASLKSQRAAGDSHWHLVERWAAEMAVPVAVAGFFMFLAGISWRQVRGNRQALFFLLIGLASSLPFLISTRQHVRYIFQSFPFYVLGLAFAADRIAAGIESSLSDRPRLRAAVGSIALILGLIAFASMLVGKDHIRDRKPFYEDIYRQKIELPERTVISACPAAMILNDWLFADMMRVYKVSLTPETGKQYLLVAKDSGCPVPEGYQRINREPARKYVLYRKGPP